MKDYKTLYERIKAGRLRLFATSDQLSGHSETMSRMATRFDAARDAKPTRTISSFNLFQTPEAVADVMVRNAFEGRSESHVTSLRVLEPSAGLGRLYRAIRYRYDCDIVLVENNADCAGELFRETRGDDHCRLIQDDFLQQTMDSLGGFFDRIIMNPPFKMGTDIKHIQHALTLLNPAGGRLVSLCYAGAKQRKAFEHNPDFQWSVLPANTFHEEGTKAEVACVVVQR